MPDRFTITLADSSTYDLNDTFRALRYDVGGRDEATLQRRDGQTIVTRQGDRLNTPTPFQLTGIVWTDDRTTSGYNAVRSEAVDIRNAVVNARMLEMVNGAGVFTLEDILGGPKPVFTPRDRWEINVDIEFWPVIEAFTFTPAGGYGAM